MIIIIKRLFINACGTLGVLLVGITCPEPTTQQWIGYFLLVIAWTTITIKIWEKK